MRKCLTRRLLEPYGDRVALLHIGVLQPGADEPQPTQLAAIFVGNGVVGIAGSGTFLVNAAEYLTLDKPTEQGPIVTAWATIRSSQVGLDIGLGHRSLVAVLVF